MWSLEVVREEYNLFNGQKTEPNPLFFVQHKNSRVVDKMFRILADSHAFEGGDKVIYKQNNKIKRQYTLCNVCCQEPIQKNQVRCRKCNGAIAKLFQPQVKNIKKTIPKNQTNKNLQYYKY